MAEDRRGYHFARPGMALSINCICVLVLSIMLFASNSATAQRLNAEQIKLLVTGALIEGVSSVSNLPYSLEFRANGEFDFEVELGSDVHRETGRWRTAKNRLLCIQGKKFAQGREVCTSLEVDGDIVRRWGKMSNKPVRGGPWKITRPGPKTRLASVTRQPEPQLRRASPPPPQKQIRPSMVADNTPPKIDVPNALTATGAVVALAGRVSDASRVIEITVDSRPVRLEPDGSFSVRRGVPQGESRIVITATDEWGNTASRRVAVTRRAKVALRKMKKSRAALGELSDIHYGNYHALVIGNNNYRDLSALKTAINDARAVSDILEAEYGFRVTRLINATRSDMIRALSRLRATLKPDDNLLIYYAGHGILDDIAGQGYWLPVDAEKDVPTNWVSVSDLTVMVRAIRAMHVMVVADSCYSGTLVRAATVNVKTARARTAWIKRMARKRSRTALVSGGLEPVLDSGGGGDNSHSVFAKAFLNALSENRSVIDGQTLFDQLKRPVVLNADQTPQYSDIRRAGHEGGDFLFVRR